MNKQTTTILGVGALAVVGYLIYKNQQKPQTFANFGSAVRCNGHTSKKQNPESPTGVTYQCCNGTFAPESLGNPCGSGSGGQGGPRGGGGRPRTRPRQTQFDQTFQ